MFYTIAPYQFYNTYLPILQHFLHVAIYSSKIINFNLPHFYLVPC